MKKNPAIIWKICKMDFWRNFWKYPWKILGETLQESLKILQEKFLNSERTSKRTHEKLQNESVAVLQKDFLTLFFKKKLLEISI